MEGASIEGAAPGAAAPKPKKEKGPKPEKQQQQKGARCRCCRCCVFFGGCALLRPASCACCMPSVLSVVDAPSHPQCTPTQIATTGSGGGGGKADKKKETQLGLSATKTGDFPRWYQELVVASELISYYDVSGCYILRPWAYSIWESVQRWFDDRIKELGVQVTTVG